MNDPVTGFVYPDEWISRCRNPEHIFLVKKGLAVLTASGSVLRRGFSTGTTAAAAAKSAVLSLRQEISSVTIMLPCGIQVEVPAEGRNGNGTCIKDAGDYHTDITAGIRFCAKAIPHTGNLTVSFGNGVGRFTRDTPRYRNGSPAVSQSALSCIVRSVQEALDTIEETGISVSITIPEGQVISTRTLNQKIGVEGGISVLGTTGLVEPWDDHLIESTLGRITAAANPVLTTGRIGLRYSRMLFPDREVILIGGKLHEALNAVQGEVTICGLPALILRYVEPKILDGTGFLTIEELTASSAFPPLRDAALKKFSKIHPQVTVVLINRDGRIIGESP